MPKKSFSPAPSAFERPMSLADKDAWLFAVIKSPTLTAAAKNVATLLYLRHNSKTGKLALFHERIANDSGLAWDTVRKRISDLIAAGFVEADGTAWNTGRKGANRYRLTFPGATGGASAASSSQLSTAAPGTSVPTQQPQPLVSSSQGGGTVVPGSLAQPYQGIIEQGNMNVDEITLSSEEDRVRQPARDLPDQQLTAPAAPSRPAAGSRGDLSGDRVSVWMGVAEQQVVPDHHAVAFASADAGVPSGEPLPLLTGLTELERRHVSDFFVELSATFPGHQLIMQPASEWTTVVVFDVLDHLARKHGWSRSIELVSVDVYRQDLAAAQRSAESARPNW